MNTSFFQELLGSIAERGRALVDRSATRPAGKGGRRAKAAGDAGEPLPGPALGPRRGLGRGAGPAGARPLCRARRWRPGSSSSACSPAASTRTWRGIRPAWEAYQQDASPGEPAGAAGGGRAAAPGAVPAPQPGARAARRPWSRCARICSSTAARKPELRKVDDDFAHLFGSWFNRGFLVLRPIDWSTPADILERIIRYEAVHEIQGWDDLRRRVQPSDRRCFGFFHPSLVDEPLIFVEVALTREIPASIQALLAEERDDPAGQARRRPPSSTRSATASRACAASRSATS